MAKLTLSDLTSLQNDTSAAGTINANGALIETALENTLSRDGSAPNAMGASLDMNSNTIINLPQPTTSNEPLRLGDIGGVLSVSQIYMQATQPTISTSPPGSIWIDSSSSTLDVYIIVSGAWVDSGADLKGTVGNTGPTGASSGVGYSFSTTTTSGDPGAGIVRFNNATPASVTQITVNDSDSSSNDVSGFLNAPTAGSTIIVTQSNNLNKFLIGTITTVTDQVGYVEYAVTVLSSGTLIDDAASIVVNLIEKGDQGAAGANGTSGTNGTNGADPGIVLTWSTNTTDTDPGAGVFKASVADLSTGGTLYIDDTDSSSNNIKATLQSFDDTDNNGDIILKRPSDGVQSIITVSGSVVDGTGYQKVPFTYQSGATSFTNQDSLSLQFARAGNNGTNGTGAGDVVGPASSVDNSIVRFDLATGKLIQGSQLKIDDTTGTLSGFINTSSISDDSTNELIKFIKATTAVNEVSIGNSATGSGPTISATGDDANIDLVLNAKGTGLVKYGANQVATTADLPTDAEIETAYNNQVAVVTTTEAQNGTLATVKRWTPALVKSAIDANKDNATATTTEAQAGTETALREWSPSLIKSAVDAGPVELGFALGDETTAISVGTGKITFRMPFAMTLTGVRVSLVTAQTSGTILTYDVNESGVSILSTKLTIDNTEKTSQTATTAAVISDTALADDAEITVDVDQIGDGTAAGDKIWLIGTRT